ncbi:MAG: carbohydrate ABC transporter permease, partial [Desulfobacterales bacterium]|nr:carbohydrate ABC transporter permease [Desulfobacterales bacterium]
MRRENVYSALIYIIILIAVIIMIGPFWWMITTSFKPSGEIFTYPPPIFPTEFTFSNYEFIWTAAPLGQFWFNSLLIASIVTPAVVFITSFAGYAFARLDFKGKRILFYLLLASLTGPVFAFLIPTFFVVNAAGLYNTYLAIILPYIGWNIALPTLILRAFFESIPSSLEDSAKIDG